MTVEIEDPEAQRLALAIAHATGQSVTQVVIEALRDRYARLGRDGGKASIEELNAIAQRAAAHVTRAHATHADHLYDEQGLPK